MIRSLCLLVTALGCAPPSHQRPEGVVVVVQEQQASWIRNFNPFNQTAICRRGVCVARGVWRVARGVWCVARGVWRVVWRVQCVGAMRRCLLRSTS